MRRKNLKKKIVTIKEQEEILNVDDKEENFNEKIILWGNEHDDNIDLNRID